jgi:3-oxoadipate enol-lactonase
MEIARPVAREWEVVLPGRRRVVATDTGGPDGAPALVLLHGVTLTARLNWAAVLPALGRRYRVITLDLPGHGRSSPGPAQFRLEDCADDVAVVASALGVRRMIPVGFSMGGLVAQLVWRRHRDLTAGLVLCSTARNVSGSPWEQSGALLMPGLVAAAAWMPALFPLSNGLLGADVVGASLLDGVVDPADRREALLEMRRTSLLDALSAIQAACRFSSHSWIGSVDVPTAVVITTGDRVVPARRQWKLARAIPGSVVHEIDGGHGVFLDAPGTFTAGLLAACGSVTDQDDRALTESAS